MVAMAAKQWATVLLVTIVGLCEAQRLTTRQLSQLRNEPKRKILGTSVLASVSVLTKYSNGTAIKSPVRPVSLLSNQNQHLNTKPPTRGQSGDQQNSASSPYSSVAGHQHHQKLASAASPTVVSPSQPTFEFYTFNSFGQLVKQFLTLSEIEAKVKHKDKPLNSVPEESHDETTTSTTTTERSTTQSTTEATTTTTMLPSTTTTQEPTQHFITDNYHTHQQQPFHDPNYWVTKPYPGQKPSAHYNEEKEFYQTGQRHPGYNAWNSLYSRRDEAGVQEEVQQPEQLMSDQLATASDEGQNVGSQVAAPEGFTFSDDSPWRPVMVEQPVEFSEPAAESVVSQSFEDPVKPDEPVDEMKDAEPIKEDSMLAGEIVTSYSQPILPPQFRLPSVSNVQLAPGGLPFVQPAFAGERNAEVSSVVSSIQGLISQAAGFDMDRLGSVHHNNPPYSATIEHVEPPAMEILRRTPMEKTTTTTKPPTTTTEKEPMKTTESTKAPIPIRRTTTSTPTTPTAATIVEDELPELIVNHGQGTVYPERKPTSTQNRPTDSTHTDIESQFNVQSLPANRPAVARPSIVEDVVWGSGHLDQGPPLPPELLDAPATETPVTEKMLMEVNTEQILMDEEEGDVQTTEEPTTVNELETEQMPKQTEKAAEIIEETPTSTTEAAEDMTSTEKLMLETATATATWILGNDKTILIPLSTQQFPTTIMKKPPTTMAAETTTETMTTEDDQPETTAGMKTTGFILDQGKITPINVPMKDMTKLHFKLTRPTRPATTTENAPEGTTEMATETTTAEMEESEPAAEPEPEPSGDENSGSVYGDQVVADLIQEPLWESPRLRNPDDDGFEVQADEKITESIQQVTTLPASTDEETTTEGVPQEETEPTTVSSETPSVTSPPQQESTSEQSKPSSEPPSATLSLTEQLEQQRGKPSIPAQTGLIYRPVPDLTGDSQGPSYALKPGSSSKPFIPKPIRVPGYTAVQHKLAVKPAAVTLQQQKLQQQDDHDPDEYVLGVFYGPTKAQIESSQAFQVEPFIPEKRPVLHHDEANHEEKHEHHHHEAHDHDNSTQHLNHSQDSVTNPPNPEQITSGIENTTQDHGHDHAHEEHHHHEPDHGHEHHHHEGDHAHGHEHNHHHGADHDHGHDHHHHEGHDHHHVSHRHAQTEKLLNSVPQGNLGLEKQFSTLLDDVRDFVRNYNELGLKSYKVLVKEFAEENLITSPFGLCSILSALFLGTRGQTAEELDRLLKLDQPRSFNAHLFNRNLTSDLINDPSLNAAVIHELFVQLSKGAPLSFYKTMLQHFYGAHVDRIPFRSATAAVKSFTEQRIRLQREQTRLRWAQQAEKKRRSHDDSESLVGKKEGAEVDEKVMGNSTAEDPMDMKDKEMYEARILSPLILADLRVRPPLSVVNVNSFHGKWKWENTTKLLDSYDFIKLPSAHRRLIKVVGIEQEADLYIGYDPELDVTLVEIPYSNTDFGLVLMLPGDPASFSRTGVRQLEEKLTMDKLSAMLRRMIVRRVRVRLPTMSNKFVLHMDDVLGMLGANTMFDTNLADFSGVNGLNDLHLKDIVQVNEFTITHITPENKLGHTHGSSSLLKTSTPSTSREPKQEPSYSVKREEPAFTVDFNRDFLYIVRHHPTGILIHLGRYVNPFT